MLQKKVKLLSPAASLRSALCVFALLPAAALLPAHAGFGQSPAAPATDPAQPAAQTPGQTGTTAAPGTAPIQSRAVATQITPQRVATYTEKWEFFGGLSFMNGQAGQNLPKRYNMGGGDISAVYWLGSKPVGRWGVMGDYRLEAGTTPVLPNAFDLNRVLVYQNIISGGIEYRGPRNRYVSLQPRALVGATHGTFNTAVVGHPATGAPLTDGTIGLYNNSTSPWGAAGVAFDFNSSPKIAFRLAPDLIFEHFGTETREFISLGGGIVYRFGKRANARK